MFRKVRRATKEAHTCHPEAVRVERFLRCGDERGMIGQPEIIIRAKIDHAAPIRDRDLGVLRSGDNALSLVKSLRFDFLERFRNVLCKFCEHSALSRKGRAMPSIVSLVWENAPCSAVNNC